MNHLSPHLYGETFRKLISPTGFEGFYSQLRPTEVLVLVYEDFDQDENISLGVVRKILSTKGEFDCLVYMLEGDQIIGFAAVRNHPNLVENLSRNRRRRYIDYENDERGSSVRRPTEVFLFSSFGLSTSVRLGEFLGT